MVKTKFNGWMFNTFKINQSPFDKDKYHGKYIRGEPKKSESIRIPKTVHNDLMTYFEGNGMGFSEGVNKILADRLQMINSSKRTCFNNIELIMIIPYTSNLEELNDKSQIITVYNTKSDFENAFIYQEGFNKQFNINYELENFSFFPMDILKNLKKDVEFHMSGTNPYKTMEWKEYHQRMMEHLDLDFNKCYFVRFPLNNYLDVNREGEFQSSRLRGWHEGLYIFDDFNHRRLYFKMEWEYDSVKLIKFRGVFLNKIDFMYIVKNADMKKVRDCHESLLNNTHDREFMESALKDAEDMKEWIEHQIAFYKKNLGR